MIMSLPVPARGLAALVALNENHRCHRHDSGHHKRKRLQRISQPSQNEKISKGYRDRGQNHNEE